MIRLHIIVEGQTEETFVNLVLAPHLGHHGITSIDARAVETSRNRRRQKIYRGGVLDYQQVKRDITRWMREDQRNECYFTTMIDYYSLPHDFPRYEEAHRSSDPYKRVTLLQEGFAGEIEHARFIPYLQLHEFEALLLADPSSFDWEFIDHNDAIRQLSQEIAGYNSPELIDDGQLTAPSKRIIKHIPEYEGRKTSAGPLIAAKIGIDAIRRKCPHFDQWLCRFETLARQGTLHDD